MSNVKVTDQRGGVYQAIIEFTYGECERLPFNLLRRIDASVEIVPDGGVRAAANFNIRSSQDSAAFLEILDMFGEDGSYIHGSPADPAALAETVPPEATGGQRDDDEMELEGTLNEID